MTFHAVGRMITVRRTSAGHYSVHLQARGWQVKKANLSMKKAQWFVILAARGMRETLQKLPTRRGEARVLLHAGDQKTNGTNWMAIRMAHGSRPIILKAPGLFRHRVIHIEPINNRPGFFNLRVVDPLSEQRSDPQVVTSAVVDRAVATFS